MRESFEQLEEAHAKLEKAHLDTLFRLSVAAEYKDEDTANHIHRMSAYVRAVAGNLGLTEDQVRLIVHASPMHDIGKIGIPDNILLKPGKLTPEEWGVMKSHTLIGERILADAEDDLIKAGQIIAISHHEKWDGSGYPKGLKGEDIPLLGRITAIADVFDALTSKRPYKPPMSNEKAFGIIEKSIGSHFDPKISEAFFRGIDEILFAQKQDTGTIEIKPFNGYTKKEELEEKR
ncbi:Cyclic di-GMP phosphodiesterase response regulator RpfG [subsurface metagenome]